MLVIDEGLKPDDLVIVEGVLQAIPGREVNPQRTRAAHHRKSSKQCRVTRQGLNPVKRVELRFQSERLGMTTETRTETKNPFCLYLCIFWILLASWHHTDVQVFHRAPDSRQRYRDRHDPAGRRLPAQAAGRAVSRNRAADDSGEHQLSGRQRRGSGDHRRNSASSRASTASRVRSTCSPPAAATAATR